MKTILRLGVNSGGVVGQHTLAILAQTLALLIHLLSLVTVVPMAMLSMMALSATVTLRRCPGGDPRAHGLDLAFCALITASKGLRGRDGVHLAVDGDQDLLVHLVLGLLLEPLVLALGGLDLLGTGLGIGVALGLEDRLALVNQDLELGSALALGRGGVVGEEVEDEGHCVFYVCVVAGC